MLLKFYLGKICKKQTIFNTAAGGIARWAPIRKTYTTAPDALSRSPRAKMFNINNSLFLFKKAYQGVFQ